MGVGLALGAEVIKINGAKDCSEEAGGFVPQADSKREIVIML